MQIRPASRHLSNKLWTDVTANQQLQSNVELILTNEIQASIVAGLLIHFLDFVTYSSVATVLLILR